MAQAPTRMTVDMQPGDRVLVGDCAVELVHKSGRAARLLIIAPREVPIQRANEVSKPVPGMAELHPG